VSVVNLMSYGAVGDGVADDTAAVIAAIASGLPVGVPEGRYKLTSMVTLQNGQIMFGTGRLNSVFVVEDDFDMDALGVFRLGTGEPGAELRDIGIEFEQDMDETVRADVIQYPPAIYAVNTPRTAIDRVRISGAWDGVKMTGNSGGSRLHYIECGALNKGLEIEGSLAFIHIDHWHTWCYGFFPGATTAIYESVYSDGETIAADIARLDGINITGLASYRGKVLLRSASGFGQFGTITNLKLDDRYAVLEIQSGTVSISGLYGSTDIDESKVKMTGGYMELASWWLISSDNTATSPLFDISAAQAAIGTGAIRAIGNAQSAFKIASGGDLNLSGVRFVDGNNKTRSAPFVKHTGGTLSVTGCRFPAIGTGSGDAVEIASDGAHVVQANALNGWGVTYPSTRVSGIYQSANGSLLSDVTVFTPTLTFATEGDLSVSYALRSGKMVKDGPFIWYLVDVTATPTYTTASGALTISGLPVAPGASMDIPVAKWDHIDLASGQTSLSARITASATTITFLQSGDNLSNAFVTATHAPSGTAIELSFSARVLA
jgi:hypothetical protein